MEIHAIGIDLGKSLFHLVDASGAVVVRKRGNQGRSRVEACPPGLTLDGILPIFRVNATNCAVAASYEWATI
jgi:hypothetical protein